MEVECGISYWMAHKCHVGEETVPPTTGAKVTSQHVNNIPRAPPTKFSPTPTPSMGIRKLPWMPAHQVVAVSDQNGNVQEVFACSPRR